MCVCVCVCVEALGAVIAEDVCAREPHPPFPASVKDGYAVIGMTQHSVSNIVVMVLECEDST